MNAAAAGFVSPAADLLPPRRVFLIGPVNDPPAGEMHQPPGIGLVLGISDRADHRLAARNQPAIAFEADFPKRRAAISILQGAVATR